MKEVKAIIQPFMFDKVCAALRQIEGIPGITVSQVIGWGKARGQGRASRIEDEVREAGCIFARKTKLEIVVAPALVDRVVEAIANAARTGNVGDGKIFITDLCGVIKIRTGERGEPAI